MVKIIGCGNPLAADDGVGVRIIKELKKINLPQEVQIIEAGNDPFQLMELLKGKEKVILVDAVKGGGVPGSVYRLLPEDIKHNTNKSLSLHEVNIPDILELGKSIYPEEMPEDLVVFGIEAENTENFSVGLSKPVEDAVPLAVNKILAEVKSG